MSSFANTKKGGGTNKLLLFAFVWAAAVAEAGIEDRTQARKFVTSTGAKNLLVIGGLDWAYDARGSIRVGRIDALFCADRMI